MNVNAALGEFIPQAAFNFAVLRIWDVFIPDPNFSIPDPRTKRFRIPDSHEEFKYF
jgi:hypothetical protein